jgi:predicted transcriptional regulator
MERTTIYLTSDLKRRLKGEATRRDTTEANVLREALAQYLGGRARTAKPRAVGRSRDGGVAHEVDGALDRHGFGKR